MKWRRKINAITPLMCTIIFLLLGFGWNLWHPSWCIFLLIPIMPYLTGKKRFVMSIPIVITMLYLFIGFTWRLWHPGWIIFLMIPVLEILFYDSNKTKKKIREKVEDKIKDEFIDVE